MSSSRFRVRVVIASVVAVACVLPGSATAQDHGHGHDAAPERAWHAGAHGVLLGTHVSPAFDGESLTEGYLTQPTWYGGVSLLGGHFGIAATISLEGLTLERGELGPGTHGEGYVDRRHPHTYLHELTATVAGGVGGVDASLTAGRGFAPFGTDDPMVRPFVRYPANHHLGQVLERLIAIAAVRTGPVVVEGGLFNGDEPSDPADFGTWDRFGDSWAARATVLPFSGVELQVSHAFLESPELPLGGGWDQRKWSASVRYEHPTPLGAVYALVEWKRTTQEDDGDDVFSFGSVLAETSLAPGRWSVALRVERTDRPEEERISPFRTPWPHPEPHVLGITRWTIVSAGVRADLEVGPVRVSPFTELSLAHVGDRVRGLFEPERFYGSRDIRSISLGVRLGVGDAHCRMGRYGVAAPTGGHCRPEHIR